MSNLFKFFTLLLLVSFCTLSCKKDISDSDTNASKLVADYDHTVVWEWNELLLQVERYAAGYRPGPISAAAGYLNLAAYEAVVTGMPEYKSMAGRYAGLKIPATQATQEYHWPAVINKVNEVFFTRMFPKLSNPTGFQISFNANVDKIRALYESNEAKYKTETTDEVLLRSRNHGEAVAIAMWDWWKTDAATFDQYRDPFLDYSWESRTNIGRWTPTNGVGKAMFPYWGKGRAMAISDGQKICKSYEDYIGKFSEDELSGIYIQALDVKINSGSAASYESQWVGQFWSDDLLNLTFSPPLRFFAIADQVYDSEGVSLEKAVFTNVKLGLACHDSGIGAWNSKYYYNLERPDTYIKRVIESSWKSALKNPNSGETGITPSFPAYPSGHATFGSSAAAVLASEFGTQFGMTDYCHKDRTDFIGTPRTFNNFAQMAQENAWSRVPLGVHFRVDAEEGFRYGTEIGQTVNKLPWKK